MVRLNWIQSLPSNLPVLKSWLELSDFQSLSCLIGKYKDIDRDWYKNDQQCFAILHSCHPYKILGEQQRHK